MEHTLWVLATGPRLSDSIGLVMMSEAEEPHGLTRGERLEQKHERSADMDTTDSLEGRMQGFVMEWVLHDLTYLRVDGTFEPRVP
jgi:hypothetical protein